MSAPDRSVSLKPNTMMPCRSVLCLRKEVSVIPAVRPITSPSVRVAVFSRFAKETERVARCIARSDEGEPHVKDLGALPSRCPSP
jgi:hypothetical protein